MAVGCRYLWTWHLSAHHVSQLGIQLIFVKIHFHESCHSFESFKRMHCPLSHCVFVPFNHATKSFCHASRCSKGIWRSFTSAINTVLCQYFWVSPMATIEASHSRYLRHPGRVFNLCRSFVLDLNHSGQWNTLLSAKGEIFQLTTIQRKWPP